MSDDTDRWLEVLSGKKRADDSDSTERDAIRLRNIIKTQTHVELDEVRVRRLRNKVVGEDVRILEYKRPVYLSMAASVLMAGIAGFIYLSTSQQDETAPENKAAIVQSISAEVAPRERALLAELSSADADILTITPSEVAEGIYTIEVSLTPEQIAKISSENIEAFGLVAGTNAITVGKQVGTEE